MSDLHERLTAAVNERLEVARAAGTPPPSPAAAWAVEETSEKGIFRVIDSDKCWVTGDLVGEHLAGFIAANDPATVIRHCERDLRVLKGHSPRQMTFGPEPRPSQCEACADMCHSRSGLGCDDLDAPYPCDEIRDLATAYGVAVDDA